MVILNPRLLELIETLTAARLNWLAFELMEGVRVGRTLEESEEALAAARKSIGRSTQPKARGEPYTIAGTENLISPDQQIEWAANYVDERLDEALKQLQASIDTLDLVVEGTTEPPDEAEAVVQPTDVPKPRAVAVLLDPEGDRECGGDNVADARKSVLTLRAVLTEWVAQSRGQGMT